MRIIKRNTPFPYHVNPFILKYGSAPVNFTYLNKSFHVSIPFKFGFL